MRLHGREGGIFHIPPPAAAAAAALASGCLRKGERQGGGKRESPSYRRYDSPTREDKAPN